MDWIRRAPSLPTVISLMALFVALGGTSVAAISLSKNSVGAKQIKRNAVGAPEIKRSAVRTGEVRNGALRVEDFAAGQLPAGPKGDKGDQGIQGIQGEPGADATDLEITVQRTDVALADNTTQAVEASCLPETKAIAGGSSVDQTGSDDITLLVSRPGNGGFIPNDGQSYNDWRAVYRNPAGGTGAAEIRAFVICAAPPAP
jgi:hypothetical protein